MKPLRGPESASVKLPGRRVSLALVGACASGMGLLLFSLASPWWVLADSVAHFRLYLCAGLVAVALVGLTLKQRRVAHCALLGVAVGLASIASLFSHLPGGQPQAEDATLKLLQLNVYSRNKTPNAVVAHVLEQRPDVIALQEVSAQMQGVVEALRSEYPQVGSCGAEGGGTVVMSRLPLWASGEAGCRSFDGPAGVAHLTVRHRDSPVTVVSLHLMWPYPAAQAQHLDLVTAALVGFEHPLIVAGDLNATPWSHAVQRLEQASRTQVVGGVRHTWFHRNWGLGLPIDHVLLPATVKAQRIEIGDPLGSDHRPVMTTLAF